MRILINRPMDIGDKRATPSVRFVYMVFDLGYEGRKEFPITIDPIMQVTTLSRASVYRSISVLKKLGYITIFKDVASKAIPTNATNCRLRQM